MPNASFVCGVSRGLDCFGGAGAVVTSDWSDVAWMVGVPARRVGWMWQCGIRLQVKDKAAACGTCRATYREVDGSLTMIDPPRDSR